MANDEFINGGDFNQGGGGLIPTINGLIVPAGLVFLQNTLNKTFNLENLYKRHSEPINDTTYDQLLNLATNKSTRKYKKNKSKKNLKKKKSRKNRKSRK